MGNNRNPLKKIRLDPKPYKRTRSPHNEWNLSITKRPGLQSRRLQTMSSPKISLHYLITTFIGGGLTEGGRSPTGVSPPPAFFSYAALSLLYLSAGV